MTCCWRTLIVFLAIGAAACGSSVSAPTAPAPTYSPDESAVREAIEYWKSVLGIDYVLIDSNTFPRLLIRMGVDLPAVASGFSNLESTDGNWITGALNVIRPPEGRQHTYRHEIGHSLGHYAHSETGLMSPSGSALDLTPRDIQMMLALYSVPAGTAVEPTGRYLTPDGTEGQFSAEQAADIMQFNMVTGGPPERRPNLTTRWRLPLRVYIQR